jgi:hypothetical protein
MPASGAWSRYRRARPPKPARLGPWQQVLADALIKTSRLAYGQPSQITLAEPPPEPNSPLPVEPPTVSPHSVVPAYFACPVRMRTTMQAIAGIRGSRSRT